MPKSTKKNQNIDKETKETFQRAYKDFFNTRRNLALAEAMTCGRNSKTMDGDYLLTDNQQDMVNEQLKQITTDLLKIGLTLDAIKDAPEFAITTLNQLNQILSKYKQAMEASHPEYVNNKTKTRWEKLQKNDESQKSCSP